jgi:predicted ATPase
MAQNESGAEQIKGMLLRMDAFLRKDELLQVVTEEQIALWRAGIRRELAKLRASIEELANIDRLDPDGTEPSLKHQRRTHRDIIADVENYYDLDLLPLMETLYKTLQGTALVSELADLLGRELSDQPILKPKQEGNGFLQEDEDESTQNDDDIKDGETYVRPLCEDNLPVPEPRLVDRGSDLVNVLSPLRNRGTRIVTLTGPAGVGKSRLAIEAANELLDDFRNCVYFVDLAPVTDANHVIPTIARTLGVGTVGREIEDSLNTYLRDKRLLLLLDNFEHVRQATPALSDLLNTAQGLKLLVTSRIRISGLNPNIAHKEVRVQPFRRPRRSQLNNIAKLQRNPTVEMFIQQAQKVDRDFQLTQENAAVLFDICTSLEGMPLAIEVIARRIQHLKSPRDILKYLLEVPKGGSLSRERTVRAALATSYNLLSADEKTLFQQLSVFAGGFTIEAAEALGASSEIPTTMVREIVASLVDQSLLHETPRRANKRYRMLEMVRRFALDQQSAQEVEALHKRFAYFFLELAEKAELELLGRHQRMWLDLLEKEYPNLQIALQWAVKSGEVELAMRLAGALWTFLSIRGYIIEGRKQLDAVLALPGADYYPRPRAKALDGLGHLAFDLHDFDVAKASLEASLELWKNLNDEPKEAWLMHSLGVVLYEAGSRTHAPDLLEKGRKLVDEALAKWQALQDDWGIARSNLWFAYRAEERGDYHQANAWLRDSLDKFVNLGDQQGIAQSRSALGWLAIHQGNYGVAGDELSNSLKLFEELGYKRNIAAVLLDLGWLAFNTNRDAARKNFDKSRELAQQLGDIYRLAWALYALGWVPSDPYEPRSCFEEALNCFEDSHDDWGRTRALLVLAKLAPEHRNRYFKDAKELLLTLLRNEQVLGSKNIRSISLAIGALAVIAEDEGKRERAAILLAALDNLYSEAGLTLAPADRVEYDPVRERLKDLLSKAVLSEQLRTAEGVIDYALEDDR